MPRMARLDEALRAALRDRRDDLVALTQALVRVPTVNPPGENYRAVCELVAARLAASGFACAFIRAEGTPGDSDRFPRWNLVARRDGGGPGQCVHFNGHIDVVEPGLGWTRDPFGGAVERRARLRPRHLRHEGRPRRGDRRGRGLPRAAARLPRRDRDLGDRRRGDRRLRRRRPPRGGRLLRARRPRHHPRAPEQGPRLPRPPRRLVGRARDLRPHRPRLDAVPRRLRGAAHGRGHRRDGGEPLAGAGRAPHRDAGGAAGGAGLDAQRQLRARRPGRDRGLRRLAVAGGPRPLPDGDRPPLPRRGGDRRGEGRVPRHRRAGARAAGASATRSATSSRCCR